MNLISLYRDNCKTFVNSCSFGCKAMIIILTKSMFSSKIKLSTDANYIYFRLCVKTWLRYMVLSLQYTAICGKFRVNFLNGSHFFSQRKILRQREKICFCVQSKLSNFRLVTNPECVVQISRTNSDNIKKILTAVISFLREKICFCVQS